jgi:hypothetical protein
VTFLWTLNRAEGLSAKASFALGNPAGRAIDSKSNSSCSVMPYEALMSRHQTFAVTMAAHTSRQKRLNSSHALRNYFSK